MAHTDIFLLAGVMGWPVMHSRSPMMHGQWLKENNKLGAYLPLAIAPDGLEAALKALKPLGFAGVNLTIPHKQTAMQIVDEVDDAARKIGAISCVTVRPDGRLIGSNNDAAGFMRNLREAAPDWRASDGAAVVVGAGGGSRAVCYGLLQAGVQHIKLVNRSPQRAERVAQEFGAGVVAYPWAQRHALLSDCALLVNTTSQGMVGQGALDLSLDKLSAQAIVADIVYVPLQTPLLAQARARGHRTVNGLGMLLHQGPLAWKAWFGLEPAVTPALRKLLEDSINAA